MNISTDIISGEIKDGKKKEIAYNFRYPLHCSKLTNCILPFVFMVRTGIFSKGHLSTADTTFTINVLHTLTVAVFSVILNKPKFSSALIFHQSVEAHSYDPPFI